MRALQCVKSVQLQSFFWSVFSPNTGKYGPEKTQYFNTFHVVLRTVSACYTFFVAKTKVADCFIELILAYRKFGNLNQLNPFQ